MFDSSQLNKTLEAIDAASSCKPSQLEERKHHLRATHEARNCCENHVEESSFGRHPGQRRGWENNNVAKPLATFPSFGILCTLHSIFVWNNIAKDHSMHHVLNEKR